MAIILRSSSIGVLLLAAAIAGGDAQAATATDVAIDPAIAARSAELADRFQSRLQAQLRSAIQQQGLAGAVTVCSQIAPAIAAEESAASGARVSRIALKNRNPAGKVPRDVKARYDELASMPVEAGKPASRIWIQGKGRQATITYLRAIPMQGQPCLSCHGPDVAPELTARIRSIYPRDKATGFTPGEMRGAMLVRWDARQLHTSPVFPPLRVTK